MDRQSKQPYIQRMKDAALEYRRQLAEYKRKRKDALAAQSYLKKQERLKMLVEKYHGNRRSYVRRQ